MDFFVLLDLDDTLCDYRSARKRAKNHVVSLLQEHGITDTERFWSRFDSVEKDLFDQFANGVISRENHRRSRFEIPASEFLGKDGASRFADAAGTAYVDIANTDIGLFDDALPTLRSLRSAGAGIAVFTNGPSDGQRSKLAALDLEPHVDAVFVSEELGAAKPDPRAFSLVLESLGTTTDQSLMVGDSPATDIKGAHAVGMAAVLVERGPGRGRSRHDLAPGTVVLPDLTDLPTLVEEQRRGRRLPQASS